MAHVTQGTYPPNLTPPTLPTSKTSKTSETLRVHPLALALTRTNTGARMHGKTTKMESIHPV